MNRKDPKAIADCAMKRIAADRTRPGAHNGGLELLDSIGIERFCEMCVEGMTRGMIAVEFGVSRRLFCMWLLRDEARSRMFLEAEEMRADWHVEEAGRILEAIPVDATREMVAKAKEQASHHRWIAEKFARRRYGSQLTIEHKETPAAELSDDALRLETQRLLDKARAAGRLQ